MEELCVPPLIPGRRGGRRFGVRDGLRYPKSQHEAESGATIPESEVQILDLGKPEELGAGSSTYLE